jgi:hypothetical protein
MRVDIRRTEKGTLTVKNSRRHNLTVAYSGDGITEKALNRALQQKQVEKETKLYSHAEHEGNVQEKGG